MPGLWLGPKSFAMSGSHGPGSPRTKRSSGWSNPDTNNTANPSANPHMSTTAWRRLGPIRLPSAPHYRAFSDNDEKIESAGAAVAPASGNRFAEVSGPDRLVAEKHLRIVGTHDVTRFEDVRAVRPLER